MRTFIDWYTSVFLNAIALLLVGEWFNGFHIAGFKMALIAAIILSILNIIVRPILIILTIPITVLTLGLFILIINAITLTIPQSLMDSGFVIDNFSTASFASIILSLLSVVLHRIVGKPDRPRRSEKLKSI